MNKIIKCNDYQNVKVLKAEDLTALHNVNAYKKQVETECEELLRLARLEAQKIKDDAYQAQINKFKQEQSKLLSQLDDKVNQCFTQITEDIYHLTYKVLKKLGIFAGNPEQIRQSIATEIETYKLNEQKLLIYANAKVSEAVGSVYPASAVQIRIDERLGDEECILETNMYIFRLNLTDAKQKISELLQSQA